VPIVLALAVLLTASNTGAVQRCAVSTEAVPPFTPPLPYLPAPFDDISFQVGTNTLWVNVWREWRGLYHKFFWWTPDNVDRDPVLTVAFRETDSKVTTVTQHPSSLVVSTRGEPLGKLAGIAFPGYGCWEVKSSYGGHTVTFVAAVSP
jgi:hypothetical protein